MDWTLYLAIVSVGYTLFTIFVWSLGRMAALADEAMRKHD